MAENEAPAPTWFTVKYGDDLSLPFNADCWAVVLIDHIKQRCGYKDATEEFDVLEESGSQVHLPAVGKESATSVLAPKGVYILARLVEAEGGTTVEQLWTPPEGYVAPPPPAASKAPPSKKK
jgi:hypothetical protein|uniref:Uncharacterized protein n=1 Tax=Haptolina ericina TaxID=156174 RepID=A0A7S3F2C6_9EUKA|mmetsp:Transcript_48191/g.108532  ORF Transcript_48191/g.108532 Transcript_48191/m.108532 type:complete len:122 (+) Transcript_48191:118-483(+)